VLDLDTTFLQALRRDQIDDLFVLAELTPPEISKLPKQYLSMIHRSITWGGQVYTITDGTFSTIGSTVDQEPPRANITFANLDGSWFEALNKNKDTLNGGELIIRMVFASVDPSDPDVRAKSQLTEGPYVLSGAKLDDEAVSIGFGLSADVLKFKFPALLARARRCPFIYKGPYCKSTSTLPTCAKTISDCAIRHKNVLRFGAWPFTDARLLG